MDFLRADIPPNTIVPHILFNVPIEIIKNMHNPGEINKMKSTLNQIKTIFKKHQIKLKSSLNEHKAPNSVTNTFFEVKDTQNNNYLIRINGNLWPPFSREDENFNLTQL